MDDLKELIAEIDRMPHTAAGEALRATLMHLCAVLDHGKKRRDAEKAKDDPNAVSQNQGGQGQG